MTEPNRIDDYVDLLDRTLKGTGRARRDLLAEVRDSLEDAAEAYRAKGFDRDRAERHAIEDFGRLDEVAPGLQEELAVGQGRRTAALLFLALPATVLMWALIGQNFSPAGPQPTPPWWFTPVARFVDGAQLLVGVFGAMGMYAFGRGLRRIRRTRRITRAIGLLTLIQMPVVIACVALMMAGGDRIAAYSHYPPGLLAVLVSLVLCLLQIRSATRCLIVTPGPGIRTATC
ncbi:permease prefix domain 1-containing protein [Rhizohabitans arisaemae]|uniref:permease prefix domain 1-containing protein n=1 Tax=Rhizohabitans arisaemae TaxID=2720610 RepID=UPI0024B05F41|nr:permease prefix domain 1-containing protein [Rhizohabitans arisaemae]